MKAGVKKSNLSPTRTIDVSLLIVKLYCKGYCYYY